MKNTSIVTLLAISCLLSVAPAHAQDQGTNPGDEHHQVISASPILMMFKWFNADYERGMSPTMTWGVSGSYLPLGDFDYGRASLLVRYYPQGRTLRGFYLGGQTGVYRIGERREHEVLYGGGVDIGYAWLLGSRQNAAVSVGFGVSRVFGGALEGASIVIPNVRLINVGVVF